MLRYARTEKDLLEYNVVRRFSDGDNVIEWEKTSRDYSASRPRVPDRFFPEEILNVSQSVSIRFSPDG